MILLYAHTVSPRLNYICDLILSEQLGLEYRITNDQEEFHTYSGARINYSQGKYSGTSFTIHPHHLISESGIRQQDIRISSEGGYPVFFQTGATDLSFDLFSASFYLISRYEEYLSSPNDEYGRFAHIASLAYQNGFLHLPLVNIWITAFARSLNAVYPALKITRPDFRFIPTYDIDIAWSYLHKGVLRNLGGLFSRPDAERLQVLAGLKQDPYSSYDVMDSLHGRYNLEPFYFFLVASARNRYDKNIPPSQPAMKALIGRHAKRYHIGLHPSWGSHERPELIVSEKKALEKAAEKPIRATRQHYIWFRLPGTFRELISAGLTDDHSMGYGSVNGFRASFASSFYWYDLEKEEVTGLRIHPFCFMDANSFYEQKQDAATSFQEMISYKEICQTHNGTMISIFHNQFLGTDPMFAGWAAMYERFISQVRQ